MDVPEEFKYLAMCFYQGSIEDHASLEDWINTRVRILKNEQQKVVKVFLQVLLSKQGNDMELEAAWMSGGPAYFIADGGLRTFLTRIAEAIPD